MANNTKIKNLKNLHKKNPHKFFVDKNNICIIGSPCITSFQFLSKEHYKQASIPYKSSVTKINSDPGDYLFYCNIKIDADQAKTSILNIINKKIEEDIKCANLFLKELFKEKIIKEEIGLDIEDIFF